MSDLWEVLAISIEFTISTIIVAIVCEAITEIVVAGSLLDIIGLRPWAARRAIPPDGNYDKVRWYHRAIHKLLTCGYCQSVWVSLVVSWTIPGGWFGLLPWDNIVIKVFLVHRVANTLHVMYQLLRKGRVNTIDLEFKVIQVPETIPGITCTVLTMPVAGTTNTGALDANGSAIVDAREVRCRDGETGTEAR